MCVLFLDYFVASFLYVSTLTSTTSLTALFAPESYWGETSIFIIKLAVLLNNNRNYFLPIEVRLHLAPV